jgi:hypothetical protein
VPLCHNSIVITTTEAVIYHQNYFTYTKGLITITAVLSFIIGCYSNSSFASPFFVNQVLVDIFVSFDFVVGVVLFAVMAATAVVIGTFFIKVYFWDHCIVLFVLLAFNLRVLNGILLYLSRCIVFLLERLNYLLLSYNHLCNYYAVFIISSAIRENLCIAPFPIDFYNSHIVRIIHDCHWPA